MHRRPTPIAADRTESDPIAIGSSRGTSRRLGRRLVTVAGSVLALATLFVGWAPGGRASAETIVVSSTPADGEKVAVAPTQITVVFNETVPANSVVQAVCDQQPAPLGPVQVGADGITLTVAVIGAIPVGTCNVTYSVPRPDGKVATGGFSFDVLDPSSVQAGEVTGDPTDGGNLASEPPPVSGPLGLVRVLAYIAIATLFGSALFVVVHWPEGIDDAHVSRFLKLTWGLATASAYFSASLLTSLETGKSFTAALLPTAWMEIVVSASGAVAVLRFVLVAACFTWVMRPDRLLEPQSQALSLALPGVAMASFAFTRATGEFSVAGTLAGLFHNLAVAAWFGGLVLLMQAVLVAPGDEDIAQALRGFTKQVPLFITVAVVSGTVHLYQLDGGAILTSRHGRLIVLKSIGVAGMVYFGMITRQAVMRRLARARAVSGRLAKSLRRAVAIEAGFGVFALVFTSWAVATLPKNIEPPGTDRTKYAFVGERSGGAFDVQVKVTPARVGLNAVRIDVYSPDTGITDLQVQFNPPTNNTASATLMVPLDGAGAARLPLKEGIPFGTPGLWTVIVSANGPAGPLPDVTYTISVQANDGDGSITSQVATTAALPNASTVPMTALVPVGGNAAATQSNAGSIVTIPPATPSTVRAGIQPVTAPVSSTTPSG